MTYKMYGLIGIDIKATQIKEQLSQAGGEDVTFELFSEGGSYFEGIAIYDQLKEYKGTINFKIQGLCASMATYIMLAGDRIEMGSKSWLMIHNPLTTAKGDYKQMERTKEMLVRLADDMADAYSAKCGKPKDEIRAMMDEETWMSAEEALKMGLVDAIIEEQEMQLVAGISPTILAKAPSRAKEQLTIKTESDMKEIISALALGSDAKEADVVAKVNDLTKAVADLKSDLATKTEDLQAKAELIEGLNASIQAKDSTIAELQNAVAVNEQAKMLSSLTESLGVMLSEQVEAKAQSRVKRILAETDEAVKAELLEDAKLFIKAYGVKPEGQEKTEARKDFSASKSSVEKEIELVEMTNQIMKEKNYTAKDYAKAVAEAKAKIGG